MRFFNTAGPCVEGRHYMLPAAARLPEGPELVEEGMYFVVHAPRQTGKTTTLIALARELTASGAYAALHVSCEVGKVARDDYAMAQRGLIDSLRDEARLELADDLQPPSEPLRAQSELNLLGSFLSAWAERCPRPLALFFDEVDALRGQSLISVLSQLRARYPKRPKAAPWSVTLCGLRDVRDYKAASGGDPGRLGTSSPFNIKVASIRLGDFTADEVETLYRQHSEDTGQVFTDAAIARAIELSAGQPWLVNALAREITRVMKIKPPTAITAEHMETAKERLILARATHLDSLVARLHEDRVRRVLEPVMAGSYEGGSSYEDDFSYVRDTGLIAIDSPTRPANPIYREVIMRVLALGVERRVTIERRRFISADGRIDIDLVLRSFAEFWRQNGEVLTGTMPYHEVAPQLVLMAYLQSIVNGTGYIDREYGVGRGRIDLCVRWPYAGPDGKQEVQREAIELKVWRDRQTDPLAQGLDQLDEYLDGLGLDHGVLVIFDRRTDRADLHATAAADVDTSTVVAAGPGRVPAAMSLSETKSPRGRAVRLLRA